jgi:uncharacterized protein (TIRG00374 family)
MVGDLTEFLQHDHASRAALQGDRDVAPPWRNWLRVSLIFLVVGGVVYTAGSIWASRAAISITPVALSYADIAAVIALVSTGVGLRVLRWYYYIRCRAWPVPFTAAVVSLLASFSLTATPGKAGELVKAMLLRSGYGVSVADCAGVLLAERIGDLVAVLLLALCTLTAVSDLVPYVVVAAVALSCSFFVLTRQSVHEQLIAWANRVPRLSKQAGALGVLLSTSRTLLRPAPVAIGFGLALVAWSMEGSALYLLTVKVFDYPISLPFALGVFGLSTLVGALSMIPGGIGSAEAVIVLLLVNVGAPAAIGSAVAFIFRLCTLWLFSAVGAAFLLIWLIFFPSKRPTRTTDMAVSVYPPTAAFESVSIILPVINETVSLRQTVDSIMESSPSDVREFIIVVCKKTTPQSLAAIDDIVARLGSLVRVHWQKLPFLGGAMREAFDLAAGTHVVMMASDLETDPACVPLLIARVKQYPDAIVTASRWQGGGFVGYSRVKLIANWAFQKIFSALYLVELSDMTYGYRIFPTRLVQAIRWDELRHPFLFETLVKPLRLGVQVFEVPAVWRARQDGESQNTFLRNFEYFRTGLRCRFTPRHTLLKTWTGDSEVIVAPNILKA